MAERPAPAWRTTMKRRLAIAGVVALVWSAGIQARLVYLQVMQHEALAARAHRQQSQRQPIPAKRGDILDRHGHVLAYSVVADTIAAAPGQIEEPTAAAQAICAALDHCDARERAAIERRLSDTARQFVYLQRQVSREAAARVAALGLAGIQFVEEDRRFYPNKDLAAHVLGYVGVDHVGLEGIEATYDELIKGRPGAMLVQTDATGSEFARHVEVEPTAGATLELTIDEYLQHIVERELRAGVRENRAAAGSALILNPRTGEILALANYPTFNPNAFSRSSKAALRNRAVQDIYEPGSTFKIVTASAALEHDVVDPEDLIDVSGGKISFGSDVIRDTHEHEVLSFTDAIVKSSNVGAIKVALELGPHRLTDYVRRFGFGRHASRHDFPAESTGIVWEPATLKDSALARVSIGYQVSVTALQMAAAVSSIANGGELIEPRVLRAVIQDGVRRTIPRTVMNRTITPAVAAELTTIMEDVVERGTATFAKVPGFSVAGKTGTSTKWADGGYLESEYNASFVGFVPSRAPVYTILVVIDSPHGPNGYYGGPVSGPVFKRIAEAALRYAGVPRTFNAPPLLVVQGAAGGGSVQHPSFAPVRPPVLVPTAVTTGERGVPDLTGLSARDALRTLSRLRLGARVVGDGVVVEQTPAAGTPVEGTARVTLRLDRRGPPLSRTRSTGTTVQP